MKRPFRYLPSGIVGGLFMSYLEHCGIHFCSWRMAGCVIGMWAYSWAVCYGVDR